MLIYANAVSLRKNDTDEPARHLRCCTCDPFHVDSQVRVLYSPALYLAGSSPELFFR